MVLVTFDIEASGQVTRAKIKSSELSNPDVELCLLSVVNKWKLANPSGAVIHDAKFPFHFKPPTRKAK